LVDFRPHWAAMPHRDTLVEELPQLLRELGNCMLHAMADCRVHSDAMLPQEMTEPTFREKLQ
jgi:hypothetical protein